MNYYKQEHSGTSQFNGMYCLIWLEMYCNCSASICHCFSFMLQVTVAPLGGNQRKKLELEKSCKVGDLKRLAQKTLGKSFLCLVTGEGFVLKDPGKSLEACRGVRWRPPDCSCTAGKVSCNSRGFCIVVWWRRSNRYLGPRQGQLQLLCNPRQSWKCSAGPGH